MMIKVSTALSITFCLISFASGSLSFAHSDAQVGTPSDDGVRKDRQTRDPELTDEQKQTAIKELRAKKLGLPISGFSVAAMKGSFDEIHGGSKHNATDMLSARNTPVLAVENGRIANLFTSKRGGLTIYEADPTGKYAYYYAHLEKYADNLNTGDPVKKGQIIGYVGTSGNAPPNTPHLHFSIGLGDALKKWWQTANVDPYEVFK